MIYPKKISAKKSGTIIKILLAISLAIAIILTIINRVFTPNIIWAAFCNAEIIYIWITVMYSLNKNINIAGHVMLQSLAISLLSFYIDYRLGMKGWSFSVSIPIIIIIANTTMLVLTIINSRRYIRYAMYQLAILIFSILPVIFIYENMVQSKILSYIAIAVSLLNFILTILLSASDVKEEIIRKFHI